VLVAGLVTAALAAAPPTVSIDADRRIGGREVGAHLRAPGFEGRVAIETRGRWSRRFPKKSYALEVRDVDGSNRKWRCWDSRPTTTGSSTPPTTTAR